MKGKCTRCGEEDELYCDDTLCCMCIMAGQEEAIKKNPEFYSQSHGLANGGKK